MQAASPNLEISKLFKLTGGAYKIINYLSIIIVSLSFAGILFTLLNNINERKYDLAILRTLGFTRERIFSIILIELLSLKKFWYTKKDEKITTKSNANCIRDLDFIYCMFALSI